MATAIAKSWLRTGTLQVPVFDTVCVKLADEEFTKQTGIRNKAEDYSLENMMRKFEYDMAVIEKKHNKLRQENRDDIDLDELTVSEDEFNDEESKKFKDFIKQRREDILKHSTYDQKQPEDQPYQAKQEEETHRLKEFEELTEQIDKLKPEHQRLKEKLQMEKYERELEDVDYEKSEKILNENIEYDHRVFDMV